MPSHAEMERIKAQLRVDEGYIDHIYNDSLGYPTFGVGHLVTKDDPEYGLPIKTKVTDERISSAFQQDVTAAVSTIKNMHPSYESWPGDVKEVMVNMAFNLGATKLGQFKKLNATLKNRNWKKAADEMKDSLWYTQVGDRGKRLVEKMKNVQDK